MAQGPRRLSADLFWEVAEPWLASGVLTEGTIMGQPCVRAGKAFVAMPAHRTGALIVKLDEAKVDALVEAGRGRPFAPAGRVFREWIEITGDDAAEWKDLLDQAVALTRS